MWHLESLFRHSQCNPQPDHQHLMNTIPKTANVSRSSTHRCGIKTASKLLLFRLSTRNYRHGQPFLVNTSIQLQNLQYFSIGLRFRDERRVALLPKELSRTQERRRVLELHAIVLAQGMTLLLPGIGRAYLPSNHVTPLIQLNWQIAMRLYPFRVRRVHDSFGCWTNCDWLGQVRLTTARTKIR